MRYQIMIADADRRGRLIWRTVARARTPRGAIRMWRKHHHPGDLRPSQGGPLVGTACIVRDDGASWGASELWMVRETDADFLGNG